MQPHEHHSAQVPADFWHTDDYREVRTDGVVYFLSRNQASAVRIMHREHLRGLDEIEGPWLLKQIDCFCTRMGEVFRCSSAWKRLVLPGSTKGSYCLSPFGKTYSHTNNSPKYGKTQGKTTKTKCVILDLNGVPVEYVVFPPNRPVVAKEANGFEQRPLSRPTHHAPCSVDKVDLLAARLARGEELWHPDDFVPTNPVMIERYVFNGRKASSYKVAELLASNPRLRSW